MSKIILFATIVTLKLTTVFSQCTSLFSFAANYENISFTNQSTVQNAHYFWHFGDGTGSNFHNPIHKFPETGNYLVTLFARDTITNCSAYYEQWINVAKYSTDSCQPGITDSIFLYNNEYCLRILDNSYNCSGYLRDYDGGPGQNFQLNNWILLGGYTHARFLSRVQYFTYDTISGYNVHREAYKTIPVFYTSSKNYHDCSANFEFTVVSEDTGGQRILFAAMNKTATFYEWSLPGFGNPIVSNNDTISQYYPYVYNNFWSAGLKTTGSSGCKDTLYQNILVQENIQTITNVDDLLDEVNYNIYPNPFTDKAVLNFPGVEQETTFRLYNTNGKIVKTISSIISGQLIIDRDGLSSGLYYFILQTDNKVIARGRIMIK